MKDKTSFFFILRLVGNYIKASDEIKSNHITYVPYNILRRNRRNKLRAYVLIFGHIIVPCAVTHVIESNQFFLSFRIFFLSVVIILISALHVHKYSKNKFV